MNELHAAALRALGAAPRAHLRAGRLYHGERRLPAPAPHLDLEAQPLPHAAQRGAADGLALRLAHADAALHDRQCPPAGLERLVFELLEQLRIESAASDLPLAGVRANLERRFADWSRAYHGAGLTDDATGLLLYAVAQIGWSRFNARALPDEIEGLIEATRAGLAASTGALWAAMGRALRDQAAFAVPARAYAAFIAERVRAAAAETGSSARPRSRSRGAVATWLAGADDEPSGAAAAIPSASADTGTHYRVWTTQYDRVLTAALLIRPALLAEYRQQLDARVARQRVAPARLAHQLRALLGAPAEGGASDGHECGQIDGRRLALLVASPGERRLFRQPQPQPRVDARVTLLVDCSGSMKQHAATVATFADTLLRALDAAGARTELLGYTTGAWNGGRARADWLAAGRPPRPGRLNELSHLVFKDAAQSWRRARPGIAALLRRELYREGIDGEAIEWACTRLRAGAPARRRILVVISDGSPMDSATAQANDELVLERHWQQAIEREQQRGIEMLAIGVGLDLSAWFRRSVAMDPQAAPGPQWYGQVLRQLERPAR